jgi:hypothetical protein
VRAAGGLVLIWMREWWSKRDVPLPKNAVATAAQAFAADDPVRGWVWTSNAVSEVWEWRSALPAVWRAAASTDPTPPAVGAGKHASEATSDATLRAGRGAADP